MIPETKTYPPWDDVVSAKSGKIFHDEFTDGIRFVITRGPFNLCAYLGVVKDHPLAGFDYDLIPLQCHGGLTYSAEGTGGYLPSGYWWYGWDYGHCDDYMISDHHSTLYAHINEKRKKWGVKEVIQNSWGTCYDFAKFVSLAERIARKRVT